MRVGFLEEFGEWGVRVGKEYTCQVYRPVRLEKSIKDLLMR